jgi:hypothetical protein
MKIYWTNTGGGDFSTAANWSADQVPGVNDIAAMTVPGNYMVTDGSSTTVLGFTTGADTVFVIDFNSDFTATEGTATGNNAGIVAIENGSELTFGGTLNNTGTIELNSIGVTQLIVDGPAFLTGTSGVIDLSGDDAVLNVVSQTLTNVNNTIEGTGSLIVDAGTGLINETNGVIDANDSGDALTIAGVPFGAIANSGKLLATNNGTLILLALFVNDSTGGIIGADADSTVKIEDATVIGGIFQTLGGGVVDRKSVV